jgi:hypothetical protein
MAGMFHMVTDPIVVEAVSRSWAIKAPNRRYLDPDFKLNLYRLPPIPRNEGTRAAAPALIAAILERGASVSVHQ